jgi:ATP-binding protein involved in chromosome partitioning
MSMAFLVAEDQPVIWRGPMLHSAVKQFLFDVMWGELDYLVVDLPPGTGDAQLSLAQQSHLMGAVIVTTPQDVSVLDVKKAISMFQQVNVPVLGVVENMAGMAITGTVEGGGRRITVHGPDGPITTAIAADGTFALELAVFGSGGGDKIAHRFGVPVLGRIPLDPAVRVGGDAGRPVVVQRPESLVAQRFCEVAGQLAMRVSTLNMATGTTMSV